MYNAVVEWLTEQREISGHAPDAGTAAFAAHSRIFRAIAAHDPAEAQIAMQEHLDQVVKFYWEVKRSLETATEQLRSPRAQRQAAIAAARLPLPSTNVA